VPQEHGNHTACKLLKQKNGLQFEADTVFEINVSGVGSNSHGPELLEKYRLAEKEIEFGFWVKA